MDIKAHMQFMQDRLALWIMGHLIKPQWGCVLWEQRKCSSIECVISWTSLKATVTPAGQVKLFNCDELEALEEINERKAPWSDWDVCPLKVNYLCEGQQGQKYLIELKLRLMCSIDHGNAIHHRWHLESVRSIVLSHSQRSRQITPSPRVAQWKKNCTQIQMDNLKSQRPNGQ